MASWRDEAEVVETKPSWRDEAEVVEHPAQPKSGLEVIQQANARPKEKSIPQGDARSQTEAGIAKYLDDSSIIGAPNILAFQDAFLPSMPWQEKVEVPKDKGRLDFFFDQKEKYQKGRDALEEQNRLGTNVGMVAAMLTGGPLAEGVGLGAKGLVAGAKKSFPYLRGILTAAPMTVGEQAVTSAGISGLSSLARNVEGLRDNPKETLRNAAISAGVGYNIPFATKAIAGGVDGLGKWFTQRAENTVPLALGISRSGMSGVGPEAAKRANKVFTEEKLISGGGDYDRQWDNLNGFTKKQGNVIGEGISDFDAVASPAGNDRAYAIGQDLMDYSKSLDKQNLSNSPGGLARTRARNIVSPSRATQTPVAPGSIPGFQIDPSTGKKVPRDVALDLNYREARDFANNLSKETGEGFLTPDAHREVLLGIRNRVLNPFRKEAEQVMPDTAKAMSEADRKLEAVNNYYSLLGGADASSGIPTAGPSKLRTVGDQTLTQGTIAPRTWSALHATNRDIGSGLATMSQKVAQLVSTNPMALGALSVPLAEAVKRDMERGNKNNEELKSAIFLLKGRLPSQEKLDELLQDGSQK